MRTFSVAGRLHICFFHLLATSPDTGNPSDHLQGLGVRKTDVTIGETEQPCSSK